MKTLDEHVKECGARLTWGSNNPTYDIQMLREYLGLMAAEMGKMCEEIERLKAGKP